MRQTIDAIRNAIEKEYWLPALALALTIPDVMGIHAGLSGFMSWKDMNCFLRRARFPLELTFRLPLESSLQAY